MDEANGRGKTRPEASSRTSCAEFGWPVKFVRITPATEACRLIEAKLGCSSSAVRGWRIQAKRGAGIQPGLSSDDMTRIKELERDHQMRK